MRTRMLTLLAVLGLLLIPLTHGLLAQGGGPSQAEKNAARFLSKATFGPNMESIREVTRGGPKAWVERQLAMQPTLHLPFARLATNLTESTIDSIVEGFEDEGSSEEEVDALTINVEETMGEIPLLGRRFAWWQNALRAPDQVHQRVAFALSEIFVVSDRVEELFESSEGLASYYDALLRGSAGNYRDLLREVTLHPVMGLYLSHLNNARSDPATGRFPDENYAREVMQLFSIGLFELEIDGTRRLDAEGNPIPTYGNREITEFAKIFTGLGPGQSAFGEDDEEEQPGFGDEYFDFSVPMRMYQEFHEPGEKRLLRGRVVPAGQSGMEDIEDAIDNLFHHPNVGPFIGRLLIQRLVTSNPTPQYVARVARAFNDNGQGVRGDMRAVTAAILLDPEARLLRDSRRADFGRLQEPVLRYTALLRAFGAGSPSGFILETGGRIDEALRQHPLSAPSVFNFFSPDHQPIGALAEGGLVAPEMQITTSSTVITLANLLEEILRQDFVMEIPDLALLCLLRPGTCDPLFRCPDFECYEREAEALYENGTAERVLRPFFVELDLETEMTLAESDLGALIDRVDLLLSHGSMSNVTRRTIREAIEPLEPEDRVHLALYLAVLSPDSAVAN